MEIVEPNIFETYLLFFAVIEIKTFFFKTIGRKRIEIAKLKKKKIILEYYVKSIGCHLNKLKT